MAEPPRDWDKELAQIDKLIAKGPAPASGPSAPPAPAGAAPAAARPGAGARPPAITRRERAGVWLRAILGVGLAVGITQWPYATVCGGPLFLYLGAAGTVVLAGGWGAVRSWKARMGLPHLVSLAVVGAGLVVTALAILPRIGYAREPLTWFCP